MYAAKSSKRTEKMPKHEFGIMPQAPQAGKCFDKYEPEKYNCISVSDDDIQPCLHAFRCGKTYWHSLDRPALGLAYCGITLIPPETLDAYLEIIWKNPKISELAALFIEAKEKHAFVIHFGI